MRVVDNSYLGTSDEVCSNVLQHSLFSAYFRKFVMKTTMDIFFMFR